tara:strand:+ start:402 stop:902 length:501 start_codon:yes stop_codon:yes gene_type:complete
MKTDKIYLIGFMAAGKSTVGKALANRLHWEFRDLDELIEKKEQLSVTDFFRKRGETAFRKAENAMLNEIQQLRRVVVATGGGTFENSSNRTIITDDGIAVWLDIPIETALSRLSGDPTRPLASNPKRLRSLWASRRPTYSLAQVQLATEGKTIEDLVTQIINWMSK